MPSSASERGRPARARRSDLGCASRACSALNAAISPAARILVVTPRLRGTRDVDRPHSRCAQRASRAPGRARQLAARAARLPGRAQLVEEALDRRDVGKAMQPLACWRAARPRSAARAASARVSSATDCDRAAPSTRPGCARSG